MMTQHWRAFVLAVGIASGLFTPSIIRAGTVLPGYDLLATEAGTSFMSIPFMGVPLGTYDFGAGAKNTANTDTIIQRTQSTGNVLIGGSATVNIQLVALQLETTAPVNFGGNGLDNYFITLQSVHGGTASTGTQTITFTSATSGTFNSSLDVFFDVRKGSLTGAIVASSDLVLSSTGTAWATTPPAGATLIDGVNHNLNGANTTNDFWPSAISEANPRGGGTQDVDPAGAPEPASVTLLGIGIAGMTGYGWRRRRQAIAI